MEINIHLHMKGEAEILARLEKILQRVEKLEGRVSQEDQKLLDQLNARSARIVEKLEKLDAQTPNEV